MVSLLRGGDITCVKCLQASCVRNRCRFLAPSLRLFLAHVSQRWFQFLPWAPLSGPLEICLGKHFGQFLKCDNQHLLKRRSSGLPKPCGAGSLAPSTCLVLPALSTPCPLRLYHVASQVLL
ncbi:hypothetical protein EI555_007805 [Monodon monoceros]|uniref:Uncharacterized protein n=1 Tax=Monodon monoceros TaxID=40151 RepID=A0A4U1ERS7_MONMO|nr:hypothetical protein EI555_007805 [Monodon monoceros]